MSVITVFFIITLFILTVLKDDILTKKSYCNRFVTVLFYTSLRIIILGVLK